MKRLLLVTVALFIMVSCNNHSRHWATINQVESFIEEYPDSALMTLQGLNTYELRGEEEKAKYSLLLSMAFDKNYIDKTDFRTLEPAINYYQENGSSTDRLRMSYYRGRIYQNRGDDAAAMNCYMYAMEQGYNSDDIRTKARLLVAQGNIYNSLMKWDKVCDVNLQAAKYFKSENMTNSYVNCMLKSVIGYIQKYDYENAQIYIDKCYEYWGEIDEILRGDICAIHLTCLVASDNAKSIENVINMYISNVSDYAINKIALANAYSHIDKFDLAIQTIAEVEDFRDETQELNYYATLTKIYQASGDFQKALDSYVRFNELNDTLLFNVFEQETQFAEERYKLREQAIEERELKNIFLILCISFSVLLIYTIIHIRNKLKIKTISQTLAIQEAGRYKLLYEQMEYERDNLAELLAHSSELNHGARSILVERLELLNKFFAACITNNSDIERKVYKELDKLLADKESFMSSTKLAFMASHPHFIDYLNERGLTDWEIQYCCLYALGLKGKEVGSYVNVRGHYNISSDIRKKLGLEESDTNLCIYIQKLLVENDK